MSINLKLSSILCKILISGHKLFRALKKDSMKVPLDSINVPLKMHVVEVERQGKA